MINPNDYVLIYRTGHLVSVGIACTLRGFNQDRITIRGVTEWYGTIEVDRTNGIGDSYRVYTVTEEEWKAVDQKISDGAAARRLADERLAQMEEERLRILESKAEEWYNNLPSEQKELADAYIWHHRPIAVA